MSDMLCAVDEMPGAGMRGVIVKEGEYGHRRKAVCCDRHTRAGESVIIIDHRDHGALKGSVILHKRCIEAICALLPPDAKDSRAQFEQLREAILTTGEAFPEVDFVAAPRGVRAVLVSDE